MVSVVCDWWPVGCDEGHSPVVRMWGVCQEWICVEHGCLHAAGRPWLPPCSRAEACAGDSDLLWTQRQRQS